jgi:protein phosphatase
VILNAIGGSNIGKVRARNEDSYIVRPDIGLFAVADGMGGHAAGNVASKTALETLTAAIPSATADEQSVMAAMRAANLAVWQRAEAERDKAGMGTTMTILAFTPDVSECIVAHVGDSRLYRLRTGRLEQLTHDHTAVQELIDQGQLTKDEARRHPLSSMLYRSVGTRPEVVVDLQRTTATSGDRYLLCSDGLTGMLGDDDLAAILLQDQPVEKAVEDLIDAANLRGGVDNITAILIDVRRSSLRQERSA